MLRATYWLDVAGIEIVVLSRQCLARRISDRKTMAGEVGIREEVRNEWLELVDWRFQDGGCACEAEVAVGITSMVE